jgi:hypothetical protein
LEGQATNLIPRSDGTASGSGKWTEWTKGAAGIAGTSVVSVEDANGISAISGAKYQNIYYEGVSGDSSAVYPAVITSPNSAAAVLAEGDKLCISCLMRSRSSGVDIKLKIRWGQADGTFISNQESGALSLPSNEWVKVSYVGTGPALASMCAFRIAADGIDEGDILDVDIFAPQIAKQLYPSSFIPTTTAALTRNQEVLTIPLANNFVGGAEGTIVLGYRPIMLPNEQPSDYTRPLNIYIDASNAWRFMNLTNGDNKISFSPRSGGTSTTATSSTTPFTRYIGAMLTGTFSTTADGSGKKVNLYIESSLVGSNADYSTPVGSLPSTIQIQPDDGQAMILQYLIIFNKRLSAAQVASVHTIMTAAGGGL